MATVVGVVFQPGGKVYSFDPAGLELRWNERVICQTARGRDYGRIVQTNHDVPDEALTGPLKRIVRRAVPADEEQLSSQQGGGEAGDAALPGAVKRHGLRAEAGVGRAGVRRQPADVRLQRRGAARHPPLQAELSSG